MILLSEGNNLLANEVCSTTPKRGNYQIVFEMKTKSKIELHAEQWIKQHPNATLIDAFVAGYWRCTDAWCGKET